ncbi:hypothetical protein [Agarilytica rhodophyticola]|uniref:hypothetical protein n=1 Tax=Agarilytica rhodophyticola TaxID=1737490 RepID=UPI000B34889A|nr:hypothetical protein [Agarilytica rhodophyticola]
MSKGGGSNKIEETEDQKELARIGLNRFRDYKRRYPQIENQFFGHINNLDSAENLQSGANVANTNVTAESSRQISDGIDNLNRSGINPNSGQFKQGIISAGDRTGIERGRNASRTQQSLQDSRLSGLNTITALGQGQEAQAIQGFSDIASESQQDAIRNTQNSINRRHNRNSGLITGAGLGAGLISESIRNRDPYGNKEFGFQGVGNPFSSKHDNGGGN